MGEVLGRSGMWWSCGRGGGRPLGTWKMVGCWSRMDWIENGKEYKGEDDVCKLMSKGRKQWEVVSMDNRWRDAMDLVEIRWQN